MYDHDFFDRTEGFKDQTPVVALFGDAYGSWPNSLSGSNIYSKCYDKYLDAKQQSMYLGRRHSRKYVYPINITPHIDMFTGIAPIGSKMNGEYFWKHMSADALRDAQQGYALIFLDYGQENFISRETYVNLHKALENSGIPSQQIILGFNTFNGKEVYESWFTPDERKLEVHNWPFVMVNSSHEFNSNPSYRMTVEDFEATRNVKRKHNFLFKIRRARTHRQALLFKMASDGILDKGDWSCLSPIENNAHEMLGLSQRFQFEFDENVVQNLIAQVPRPLECEKGNDYSSTNAWTDRSPIAHESSYFYICTETYTTGEHKS
jgi:hypothetical protein